MIEFLHDHCSKEFSELCSIENKLYSKYYDDIEGQKYFRKNLNPILLDYEDGFEISENGEILILSDNGLSNIFDADILSNDAENITKRIDTAIIKFRRHSSTLEDRRDAIRELADVLEFLRPQIKKHLSKDENDIFNIANNFGIRHHNQIQKVEYDKIIWYSWIFYYYLATIHAVLRLKDKQS